MFSENDHVISIRMESIPDYKLLLKLSDQAASYEKMTVLLFAIDLVKERTGVSKMENKELSLFFDPENPTTAEEVINTSMEELLLKRKG